MARPAHARLVLRLLAVVVAGFAFGYALVPLYYAFCEATGLNGTSREWRTGGFAAAAGPIAVDASRTVTVEFTGMVMPGLDWEMRPLAARLDVHPGEAHEVRYRVHNASSRPLSGRAVPSVSPGQAARHFQKIECFCFRGQTLAPGETREMPVVFIVRPGLDGAVRTLTLSYAFYGVPDGT